MNKLVKSREIYWCESDDRFVLVVREDGDVVGLNYMQGDDLELFELDFSDTDNDLTKFYNSVIHYLTGYTEIDRINQAIWAYHSYAN